MTAPVDVLRKPCKCVRCGEVMPAGASVAWESVSYGGASGEFCGARPARWVARHAEYCKALRAHDLAELLKAAKEAREVALGMLFVANDELRTTERRAQCLARFREKIAEARRRMKDAKRTAALARVGGGK